MDKWIKLKKDAGAYKAGDVVQVPAAIAKAYIDADAAEETDAPADALSVALAGEIGKQMKSVTDEVTKGLKAIADDLKTHTKGIVRSDPGESQDDKTKSFNDQVACITKFQKLRDQDAFERLIKVYGATPVDRNGNIIRGHEGAAGSTGGFLVGVEYGDELLKLDAEADAFAAGVRVIPMGSPQKKYPALRQTGTPASGSTAAHGGIRTFRKSEKAARTPSEAAFDEIEFNATDLIAYTESTNDLLDDAPGAEADFLSLIRGALGWRRDWDFINGGGDKEPLGFRNSPALITVNRESAGAVSFYDLVSMLSRILPAYMGRCEWLANPLLLPQLATLKDDAGNAIWMTAREGAPQTLCGRPLKYTEKVPAPGNAGDINLVVPGLYLEGQRSGVEIGVSEEFLFSTDQTAWRAKMRNDGKPWMKGPYTLADGSGSTVSGFVQLGLAS